MIIINLKDLIYWYIKFVIVDVFNKFISQDLALFSKLKRKIFFQKNYRTKKFAWICIEQYLTLKITVIQEFISKACIYFLNCN